MFWRLAHVQLHYVVVRPFCEVRTIILFNLVSLGRNYSCNPYAEKDQVEGEFCLHVSRGRSDDDSSRNMTGKNRACMSANSQVVDLTAAVLFVALFREIARRRAIQKYIFHS